MRTAATVVIFLLTGFPIASAGPLENQSYRVRNPELGIVYRPINWDRRQWEEIFDDPAPPVGWAILPIGREGCSAITSWWLTGIRNKGLRAGVVLTPFLNKHEIEKTIECSVSRGVQRIILDEYVSYHTKNLNRPLCTVLSETRQIYQNAKNKYPSLQLAINDNWQTWMADLSQGQSTECGSYPHFQYDQTGVSVLSKYNNPAQGECARPTVEEMREQLIDLKPTVRDYSKTGKIFAWQLNQHWYPGGAEILQLFREMKKVYGWNRFLLFGPTAGEDAYGNWGYNSRTEQEKCPSSAHQWYLPAREYLIRMTEGRRTSLRLVGPTSVSRGSKVELRGKIRSGKGIQGKEIRLQVTPPPGSLQRFQRTLIAPAKARIALVGLRVNVQIPFKITGSGKFQLDRVRFFETGEQKNLVRNSEFDNGLDDWFLISTSQASVLNNGAEKSLGASVSPQQSISMTSSAIFVKPGHSYTVQFDARIFQEARSNGYFYVSWLKTSEIKRDRIFLTFPDRHTATTAISAQDGSFAFRWQPSEPGIYTLFGFFPGSTDYQPAIVSRRIEVN